jgi:hypothetical protein
MQPTYPDEMKGLRPADITAHPLLHRRQTHPHGARIPSQRHPLPGRVGRHVAGVNRISHSTPTRAPEQWAQVQHTMSSRCRGQYVRVPGFAAAHTGSLSALFCGRLCSVPAGHLPSALWQSTARAPYPPYRQIATILRERIRNGTIPPGRRIPSLIELEKEFDAVRDTLRKAVRVLKRKGLSKLSPV